MKKREGCPNKCRYFNGGMNKVCDAGKVYDEISRVDTEGQFGCFVRLPCTRATEDKYPCDALSRLSDEEVKEEEERLLAFADRAIAQMNIACPAIVAHIGDRKGQGVRDSLPCPICGTGTLRYVYVGNFNGHIHAACTTEGCANWGE